MEDAKSARIRTSDEKAREREEERGEEEVMNGPGSALIQRGSFVGCSLTTKERYIVSS